MFTGILIRQRLVMLLIVVLAIALAAVSPAVAAQANGPTAQSGSPATADAQPAVVAVQETPNPYFSLETVTRDDGSKLERMIINSPPRPPQGYELERPAAPTLAGDVLLPVPAYSWVFGCSAVSASMIAAYLDQNGLPNMYTGPTNGGVMPMDNSTWPTWTDVNGGSYPSNPLTASRNGLDGRATRGSIDDYWVYYNSNVTAYPDPYITGSWTQHAWGDAVGDYMWTSQSTQGNTDGATSFWGYSSAGKLSCATMESGNYDDGTVGRKHFYEARGYAVAATECYNQKTDNKVSGGFSFAQYKAKIDAGYPVFLNLEGHSVVGIGYNATTSPQTVYLNDTWNWLSGTAHSMPWGGSYSNMPLVSVSIADPVLPTTTPAISINDVSVTEGNSGTVNATFTVSLSVAAPGAVSVDWATADGTATAAGTDYAAGNGTVSFAAGELTKPVTVQVYGDTAFESNETFSVNLSNPIGGTLADGQGMGTILNDDLQPANVLPVAMISATPTSGYAPLAVSFSSSGSYDPDGSIVSYGWNFGDGSSGAGATATHTYAAVGNYTAVLTVTDNRGGTGTAITTIAVSQEPAKARVGDITMSVVTSGKNRATKAVIKVTNLANLPVANATVNVRWSGLVTGTGSGKTDASGQVTLTSKSTSKRGTVTVTVTGVTPPAGSVYDPTNNLKTSASIAL